MSRQRSNKRNTYRAVVLLLSLFFIAAAVTGKTTLQTDDGKTLYERHCVTCHGGDGTKGFFGAKNLQKSQMTDTAIVERIQRGKRFMPSFKKKMTVAEMQQIISYIKTFRTH